MEAPPGFEPGMEVLQTSALPLGDGAVRRESQTSMEEEWSGKRDSNPRLRPWQGRTLPLSYSRSALLQKIAYHLDRVASSGPKPSRNQSEPTIEFQNRHFEPRSRPQVGRSSQDRPISTAGRKASAGAASSGDPIRRSTRTRWRSPRPAVVPHSQRGPPPRRIDKAPRRCDCGLGSRAPSA